MRRLFVALSLALVASPAWAARWVQSNNGGGVTDARLVTGTDATWLYATKYHGTTNPPILTAFDTSGGIAKIAGRTITNFNEVLGLAVDATNHKIFMFGRGRWMASTLTSSLGAWTNITDLSVSAQGYGGGSAPFGADALFVSIADLPTDTFSTYESTSGFVGVSINAASGFANYEQTSVAVSGSFGCGAAIDATTGNAGTVVALGIDGAGNSRWTQSCSGTVRGCDSTASVHQIRQAFTDGSLCVVLSQNTSTGDARASAWDSSGVIQIQQALTSTTIACGFYGNLDGSNALWAFTAGGAAYKSTGGNFSASASYNITLDGGESVNGCSVVNSVPTVLTTGGDKWEWKTPAVTYVPIRSVGPFR